MLCLARHGYHHCIDTHLLKIRVVNHGRLETMGGVSDVSDQLSIAIDHAAKSLCLNSHQRSHTNQIRLQHLNQ